MQAWQCDNDTQTESKVKMPSVAVPLFVYAIRPKHSEEAYWSLILYWGLSYWFGKGHHMCIMPRGCSCVGRAGITCVMTVQWKRTVTTSGLGKLRASFGKDQSECPRAGIWRNYHCHGKNPPPHPSSKHNHYSPWAASVQRNLAKPDATTRKHLLPLSYSIYIRNGGKCQAPYRYRQD